MLNVKVDLIDPMGEPVTREAPESSVKEGMAHLAADLGSAGLTGVDKSQPKGHDQEE